MRIQNKLLLYFLGIFLIVFYACKNTSLDSTVPVITMNAQIDGITLTIQEGSMLTIRARDTLILSGSVVDQEGIKSLKGEFQIKDTSPPTPTIPLDTTFIQPPPGLLFNITIKGEDILSPDILNRLPVTINSKVSATDIENNLSVINFRVDVTSK